MPPHHVGPCGPWCFPSLYHQYKIMVPHNLWPLPTRKAKSANGRSCVISHTDVVACLSVCMKNYEPCSHERKQSEVCQEPIVVASTVQETHFVSHARWHFVFW